MSWSAGANVVMGGEGKVKIYSATTFTTLAELAVAANLIGELTDISGIGASKNQKEIGGYHYTAKKKLGGQTSYNDVSFTENLTLDQLETRRSQFKNGTKIFSVISVESDTSGAVSAVKYPYAVYGTITSWGMEVPDGDVCKLTYTMSVITDDPSEFTISG